MTEIVHDVHEWIHRALGRDLWNSIHAAVIRPIGRNALVVANANAAHITPRS